MHSGVFRNIANVLICIAMVAVSGNVLSATVRITTEINEPYEVLVDGKVVGLFAEVVNAAFNNVGIRVVYEITPWKRAYKMAKDGRADATMPWYKTPEREKDFIFSDPVVITKNKFFILKKSAIPVDFQWTSFSDFKGFRVGGVNGYWYQENFKKNGVSIDLVLSDTFNLQKLQAGRIDTFITDELIGWYLINRYYPNAINKFATLDRSESTCGSYLIAGRENPHSKALIDKFNEGLKILVKSGEYEKIRRKYLIKDDGRPDVNESQNFDSGCK